MQLRDAQSCLSNAIDLASWCEEQAIGLDPLIHASRNGRTLSPGETLSVLIGVQQLHRRTGQQHRRDRRVGSAIMQGGNAPQSGTPPPPQEEKRA